MKWNINLDNLSHGGFAPLWFNETYPSFGNKNQAGAMANIDMTNAGFLTQGPGLSNWVNGTQAGAVTTLLKGTMPFINGFSYATGGDKLYQLEASSTVTNSGSWPHTIDKGGVTGESGEDVALYDGKLFYSYTVAVGGGDVGRSSDFSTFDDDFMSTVPSGATNLASSGPHPMKVGGNNVLYIGNGESVASYDATTFIDEALDLPSSYKVYDLEWHKDRLWILASFNPTGLGVRKSSIFIWDGTLDSWEAEIEITGDARALHLKDGRLYVFYRDNSITSVYKIAVVEGDAALDIESFTGGTPAFYQTRNYKDFILFAAGELIWAYGSGHKDLPARLFQFADGGYSTLGGLSLNLGVPMIASTESTNYKLATLSGYDTACSWKSLLFDITGYGKNSRVEDIRINFEQLATGASCALAIKDNQGRTLHSDTISYSKLGAATTLRLPFNGKITENFRIEFDFAGGSTTNPVKFKNIRINGATD